MVLKYDFMFTKEESEYIKKCLDLLYNLEQSTDRECKPISKAINELQKLDF